MKNLLRMTLLGALVVVPVSIIAMAVGGMLVGIPLYVALALFMPFWLRRQERLKPYVEYPWRGGLYFYSWFGWVIFFYMGERVAPLQMPGQTLGELLLLWFGIFLLGYIGMSLTAAVLALFFKRPRINPWLDETLDIAVYALPIPMLLIGDILFMNLGGLSVSLETQAMILDTLNLFILLLVVCTMGSIAFYLFPRHEVRKAFRLLRILITAFVWLAINGHIFAGGWLPEFVRNSADLIFPAFRGNPLVYVSPALIQLIIIGIANGIGLGVESGLTKLQGRFKSQEEIVRTKVEDVMKTNVPESDDVRAAEEAKKAKQAAKKARKKR
ncbi:hypothetical protein [uncultured Veillonella sp.]|uniref:hypothetical protein n=1 Tax=uncultured Veillonella sp. TaxID=159268 RepID=UPI0025E25C07|nr:hypothetical protein [uncultured Veillonella sp.]MDY3974113.1 hypothetical protein [Veillonella caviae]